MISLLHQQNLILHVLRPFFGGSHISCSSTSWEWHLCLTNNAGDKAFWVKEHIDWSNEQGSFCIQKMTAKNLSRKGNMPYSLWAVQSKRKEKWGTLKGALVNLIATSMFSFQNIGVLEIGTESIDYIIPLISLSWTWSECRLYDEFWVSHWTIS